jgi:hypothetical protein
VYLLAVVGHIACKDASVGDAFSSPWTLPSTFYKLLEIERKNIPTPVAALAAVKLIATVSHRIRLSALS